MDMVLTGAPYWPWVYRTKLLAFEKIMGKLHMIRSQESMLVRVSLNNTVQRMLTNEVGK